MSPEQLAEISAVGKSGSDFVVPFVGLRDEFNTHGAEIMATLRGVFADARFVLRDEVADLEQRVARLVGVEHAVAVGSGTDALFLALKALGIGPGDEVITVAHTFVATLAAIVHSGARPVLADIDDDHNVAVEHIEGLISSRTKAIIAVHMNGRLCDMQALAELCQRHGLRLLEDAAQAFGAKYRNRAAGSFGDAGCFSFHPMKVLHGYGDGGMVTTASGALADQLRRLRNHGQISKQEIACFGYNSRLDNVQAALILLNLRRLKSNVARRRHIAARYTAGLGHIDDLVLPPAPVETPRFDVYSCYSVCSERRDELRAHLTAAGIETFVHWEIPLHQQAGLDLGAWSLPRTERLARSVVSLPIHEQMSEQQIDYVVATLKAFHERS